MSARQRAGIGMVALAVAAGTLTGCGSKAATTSSAVTAPTTAPAVLPTTVPAVITPATRASITAAQSAVDPFASSGAGGGSSGSSASKGAGSSTTTVPVSGSSGASSATSAPTTTPTTTGGSPTGSTTSPTTAAPTTGSPTTTIASSPTTTTPGGTTPTTVPASTTTTTLDPTDRYVAWAIAKGQPDLDELSRTLAAITKAIALRGRGGGSGPMHTDGARLVRQAVGMEAQAGPPIASLTKPWHVVLHSYVAYGRSVRAASRWSTLIADLRGISAALTRYDRAADTAGVGPKS